MINLLSSRQKQFFLIVKNTYKVSRNKEEICKKLSITNATLEKNIEDFNQQFYPFKLKEYQDAISFVFPNHLSCDQFISKLLETSIEFQILEAIFFSNDYSYEKLADKLFVSKSTLIRVIKRINQCMESSDVLIKKKPIQIVGNEHNIRFLYITYFKDRYGLSNLPFPSYEIEAIKEFYTVGIKIVRKDGSIQEFNNFLLFSLISLRRESMGFHKQSKRPTFNERLMYTIVRATERTPYFRRKRSIELLDPEFASKVFALFLSEGFLRTNLFSRYKQKQLFRERNITQYIEKISECFDLIISENEKFELSQTLFEILYGYLKVPTSFDFLDDSYTNFREYHLFPIDYLPDKFEFIFKDYFSSNDRYSFNFLFFTIYTRWPGLVEQLENQRKKVNVFIYIDFDFNYGEYIRSKLLTILKGNYIISVKKEGFNELIPLNTDVLVTNVIKKIDFPSEKIINVSHFLTEDDLEIICKKVMTIENK